MVLDDLGTLLQAAGVGTLGATLFKGRIPLDVPGGTAQHSLLALIEVPGMPSERVHDGRDASVEQPMIQVVARGLPHDYMDARTRAQAAYETLDGLTNVYLGTTFYREIWAQQPPFVLRQSDDLGRPIIVFTIRIAKAMAPSIPFAPLTSFVQGFVQQTTLFIPGSVHRLGTQAIVWAVYDAATPALLIQSGRFTVAPGSYDVRLEFAAPQSGRLLLSTAATPGYSTGFANVTTVTIPGTVHGLGTRDLIPALYDAATPAAAIQGQSLTVHPTTFDVEIVFAVPQSGWVVLYGAV